MSDQPDGRPAAVPEVVETHISVLFFLGDRVYKLKKPVRFGFVDLTDRAERERICHREVELNRRLAPDVYLGVLDIVGPDGRAVDHLVEMRRMPSGRRLADLVRRGEDTGPCLRELAHLLATFHASAEQTPDAGAPEAISSMWDENLDELAPFAGRVLDAEVLDRVRSTAHRYLEGRRRLLIERVEGGHIRDGHGDLLAEDIFCLDDGPRVLDCIEFNDRFRHGDVVADIAFLAMDLERLGAGELAGELVGAYRERSGESFPESLVDHYVAYRALIRSKVACLRSDQADGEGEEQARMLLELADTHLERARVRLVLVGGLPGVGKSTLAAGLSETTGWMVLRSDEVRKDLAGLAHDADAHTAFGGGVYSEEMTDRTYSELIHRARQLLERGVSVILDASWTDASRRETAAETARATSSDLVQLRCVLPSAEAARRMERRAARDPSDADARIAAAMSARSDPWPDAVEISTGRPPDEVVEQARRALESSSGPSSGLTFDR